jgi:hypothetical protein
VDDRDKKSERRKQACAERLRTNNFICIGCGCTYSCASERHHIAGKHYDKLHIEDICATCHCRLTEAQRSHPHPINEPPSDIESAAHYNLGVSDLFALRARLGEDYGNKLLRIANNRKLAWDQEARALTREAGHYLIASSACDDRIASRLRHYADCLIDEARKNTTVTQTTKQRKREDSSAPAREQ